MRMIERANRRGGWKYEHDQEVTVSRPSVPAAVRLFSSDGLCRVLAFDFDVKGLGREQTAADARQAADVFSRLGARVVTDVSARGGRHVWVPLAETLDLVQAREIQSLAKMLWPTLDISPAVNVRAGCLTAPGSHCKEGGERQLTVDLADAIDAVKRRAPRGFVAAALQELRQRCGLDEGWDTPSAAEFTDMGANAQLPSAHERIAVTGIWPSSRKTPQGKPWTRSEACFAVLGACHRAGIALDSIRWRMLSGQWNGLLCLYQGRYGRSWDRRLSREWKKAATSTRRRNLSDNMSRIPPQADHHTGGAPRRVRRGAPAMDQPSRNSSVHGYGALKSS